ncbi:SH2 domain-containing protein B-like isoform X5 [Triticum dicoccoides]|uniref:SH2 domain-containing protein B-like isoform X5 n=1 Tax=Triticum dicoccoides TaxID=85692 RepID=UPI00188FC384|nr:SH2 domain-containing protein B-like isoform X5 [Triticum dicoccoides]
MAAPAEPGGIEGYLGLRDVRVELDLGKARGGGEGGEGAGGGFAVCFWLYLSGSARPSPVILHQITAGDGNKLPFLALSEGNKLLLFPLLSLHKQAPSSSNSSPWTDTTYISAVNECPLEHWIHIGCEVTENVMRLHIDGDLVAEAHLCSLSSQLDNQDDAYQVCLLGNNGKVDGYVYNVQVLSMLGAIQEQYTENPPSKLSIDYSCCDGIEEGDDGIWCIVGGKASCRRNFMLEVVLTNAFGEHMNKDTQIVASLVYADNGALVEKSRDDAEPPLLIACEGLEYPAESRPLPILRGRALFKLKISQSKQARKMVVEAQSVRTESTMSDSDSIDARSSWSGSDKDEAETLSDAMIFRYCLEGTYERSTFLKSAASSINVDDLITLANEVSLYSGCSHHRNQILISKQLLEEGAVTWSIISKNKERALWSSAVPEIMSKFMDIAHSTNRGLSEQDLEVLKGIAGCGADLGRNEFDRLWYWLYPVAVSLSKDKINSLWGCTAPAWIEGLITTEEAENALRSSRELLKKPGTFVLRFPTTRSWPHPDAGSLVVTYVGSDNSIHHRLLSLDVSDARAGSLQDLLLQEPELLQLGRVDRLPTAMKY